MNHDAYTVAQFCKAHGNMSRTSFYKMLKNNHGPRIYKVGTRTYVSTEAAAQWRATAKTQRQQAGRVLQI